MSILEFEPAKFLFVRRDDLLHKQAASTFLGAGDDPKNGLQKLYDVSSAHIQGKSEWNISDDCVLHCGTALPATVRADDEPVNAHITYCFIIRPRVGAQHVVAAPTKAAQRQFQALLRQ